MDYSKLSMSKLVNAYQNYVNDVVRLGGILKDPKIDNYPAIYKMYELTLCELNSVLTIIIDRLNLKGEK